MHRGRRGPRDVVDEHRHPDERLVPVELVVPVEPSGPVEQQPISDEQRGHAQQLAR
ncbi:hypothetical protein [Janibacter melonis]|uniref:hypothetical protein n=1 Tax=Janibacter melonis TaxID=262209 RepID=UPI0012ED07E2|nr:hypothetical protein [Janibacter melonis]